MNNNLISIIIPIYNVEQYLRQCLDSVINQTYKNIEIIIINDCSPDNSLQIIKEYQQKDSRIKLINLEKNIGLGFARNEGLKIAKGKYITFIDSDDWVKKDYIEILYNTIISHRIDIVIAETMNFEEKSQQFINVYQTFNFYNTIINDYKTKQKLILSIPCAKCLAMLINKSFIDKNNIFFLNEKPAEDYLFFFELLQHNSTLYYINEQIYYYRQNRPNSIMTNFNKSNDYTYQKLFGLFDKIIQIFQTNNTFNMYSKQLYVYILLYFSRELVEKNLNNNEYFEATNKFKIKYLQHNLYFLKVNRLKNKLRLLIFTLCLKYNINYTNIGKTLKNLNSLTKKQHIK